MSDSEDIRKELGLVQIYTGNGKGKSTAAFGLAVRAAGRGLNVLILQFMKPEAGYGEQVSFGRIGNVDMIPMGRKGFVFGEPKQRDIDDAHAALAKAAELMASRRYDVVILDEAMNAVRLGLISSAELIAELEKRPEHTEVVLTGRGLPKELEEYADLVTEMKLIKHPSDRGMGARAGIEYRRRPGMRA